MAFWAWCISGRKCSTKKTIQETILDSAPDWEKLAEAYNLNYMRIDTLEQCNEQLAAALTSKEGWFIDFRIDANADVYPMVPAGKGLDDIVVGE